jgi:hypothetical protein
MQNAIHEQERVALDQGLRDGGSLAVRMLSAAVESCVDRDAARANVVLAFERDVSPQLRLEMAGGDVAEGDIRVQERTRGLIERIVDLALHVADIARLASRRGAPPVPELDRLCRLGGIAAVTGRNLLSAPPAAYDPLADVLDELLRRAEGAAQRSSRELDRWSMECLAS